MHTVLFVSGACQLMLSTEDPQEITVIHDQMIAVFRDIIGSRKHFLKAGAFDLDI